MWWKRTKQRKFIDVQEQKKDRRLRINYAWIVHHIPFLLFLFVLAILYIANGHYAVKNARELNKLQTAVKELHWDYLNNKSELMFRSKMSEISDKVAPYGLKIPVIPSVVIPEEGQDGK